MIQLSPLLCQLPDGKSEVGLGEWLVLQREVPPLAANSLEPMTQHGPTQNHTVGKLLGSNAATFGRLGVFARILARLGIAAEVRVTFRTEPVERPAHVHLFLRRHVEQCQVNGAATRMAALLGYIALHKEHALVEVGIEVALHQRVRNITCPAHKVVDGLLWTVGIVNLQAVALFHDVVAHGTQAVCRPFRQQRCRLFVAVNALAYKVICSEIANLQNGIGHRIRQRHKLTCIVSPYGGCGRGARFLPRCCGVSPVRHR